MGQKTNPKILRIPLIKKWESQWIARGHYFRKFLKEDILIRKYLQEKLKNSAVSNIEMERAGNDLKILIKTARPGIIIGRGGVDVEKLKKEIKNKFLGKDTNLELNIEEYFTPFLSARIVLEFIINEIERRIPYRRVMKKAIERVKKAGAKGVRISLAGRLDGVEIARTEKMSWGKLPLHTLRADIDYARGTAFTLYGTIGVKVWIYKGEIFGKEKPKIETK